MTVLSSCGRQNISPEANHAMNGPLSAIAVGDTVNGTGNNIMTVYQDKKNNYWFGSWQDGLYKYDGKTILHFITKNGLPHYRVEDIQEDQWGKLYFNTSEGLCTFDGKNFRTLHAKESAEWKLEPGDLWFKSLQFEGSVYRYDGKELHRLQLPEPQLGKDWISEEDVTELHDGPSNGVRSIIEDKDGCFWFNSAYRYEVYGKSKVNKQTFYNREKSIGNLDGSPDSDFWEYLSIARDNNNELWIATYRNGVWRYDGKRTTYYPVRADGKDITLFYIYKDNKGGLWLGTHENGAYTFNGRSFERFKP